MSNLSSWSAQEVMLPPGDRPQVYHGRESLVRAGYRNGIAPSCQIIMKNDPPGMRIFKERGANGCTALSLGSVGANEDR